MYACYVVFNNAATICESLTSILPYVEKIVAIDGVYQDYPHKEVKSTDATKEICFELCDDKLVWVDCDTPWPSQAVKRTQYLNHVPNGEWFIQIDGDEVIKGKVAEAFKFAESSRFRCLGILVQNYIPLWEGLKVVHIHGFPCYEYAGEPIRKQDWDGLRWKSYRGIGKRVYRKTEGMEYRTHVTIWIGKECIHPIQANLKGIRLINMNYKRGWERWQQNYLYKRIGRR